MADSAHPGDLLNLGDAAYRYGLYRDAAQLYKHGTTDGDPLAGLRLVSNLYRARPSDHRPASWAARNITLDNPLGVARLLNGLLDAGAEDQVNALVARDPATRASLGNIDYVVTLLKALRKAGANEQTIRLADRAADSASLDDPLGVAELLHALREASAKEQVGALVARDPAAHAVLGSTLGVAALLTALREAGADGQVGALAYRATQIPLDYTLGVAELLEALSKAGAREQTIKLADRAVDCAALDDPLGVARLITAMRKAGTEAQVSALVARDLAAQAALDDPLSVAELIRTLRDAGASMQATALADRAAAHDYRQGAAAPNAERADTDEQSGMLGDSPLREGVSYSFNGQESRPNRLCFGYETDGSPAKPWGWEDLS